MRPEYTDEYERQMGPRNATVGTAVDPDFKRKIELVASIEGTTPSQLMFEGLTRVIEDRKADPEFRELLAQHMADTANLAEQLGIDLGSPPSA